MYFVRYIGSAMSGLCGRDGCGPRSFSSVRVGGRVPDFEAIPEKHHLNAGVAGIVAVFSA
jgi:hypothetical protein